MTDKVAAEAAAAYFDAADDEEFIESLTKDIHKLLEKAIVTEREACAKVADEKDNYWNTVAYDQRQAEKSDIDASARAGSAMIIASAIRARTQGDK